MAPPQRPIIILPQNIAAYGAISEVLSPPKASCLSNSPKLLATATSTPTYVKIANIPQVNCGYCIAPQPSFCFVAIRLIPNNPKRTTHKAPISQYIRESSSGFLIAAVFSFNTTISADSAAHTSSVIVLSSSFSSLSTS